jgi:hypothetical protein
VSTTATSTPAPVAPDCAAPIAARTSSRVVPGAVAVGCAATAGALRASRPIASTASSASTAIALRRRSISRSQRIPQTMCFKAIPRRRQSSCYGMRLSSAAIGRPLVAP